MSTWQVQEAKARLSELIEKAVQEGPQTISRHGTDRVVVISVEEYQTLTARKPNFKEYLLGGPKMEDFSVDREPDFGREVSFD